MMVWDEDGEKRVRKHRKMRAEKHFETRGCFTGLKDLEIQENALVLLECMSNLTANEIYQKQGAGERTVEEICRGIDHLLEKTRDLVIVTNEVFSDGITYDDEMETYRSYLGRINRYMTGKADLVVEVVYGIPMIHKGQELS